MYRPFILLRPERSHIGDVARSCWLTLLLAIGSWAFVGVPAPAQVFEYIGMEQGLSSRRVLSIEQDAQGYMWILTHKGVDRYDGTRFTHYKLRSEGKDMYFYPDLNTLYADSGQALWEFGKDGKIFRFDYRKDAFELVFDLHQAVTDTRNYPITSVYLDPSLRVWFHCYQQTVVFDTRQRTCRTVTTDPTMAPVDAMVTDGENGYFLAAGPTLYHAAYADGELKTLSSITLDRIRLINYLYYHPHTRKLVVNTLLDGLYIIDTNHWEVLRPAIRLKDIGINIVKPFFDSTTEVLVATDGDGVYKLDITTGELSRFLQEDNLHPNKMNGSIVKDILIDQEQRVWNVIYPTGLTVYTRKYPAYQWLRHTDDTNSLVDNRINALLEDSDGDIWMATCNGISCYQPSTGQWTNYLSIGNGTTTRHNHIIISICEIRPGTILAGGYMAGLYTIDKRSRKVNYNYRTTEQQDVNPPDKYIRSIITDREHNIWAGGYRQLECYNPNDHQVRSVSTLYPITHIKEKDERTLWIGTIDGLFTFDKQRMLMERYGQDLQTGCVNTIYQQPDGSKTFIGTYGNGLLVIDNATGQIQHYHKDNSGLANNNIYSIVPNAYNDLFLGTENGLTLFDTRGKTFINWTREQGLLSASFNQNAAVHTRNGQLIFGTNEGAILLSSDTQLNEDFTSHMIFSNLNIMYRNVHPGDPDSPLVRPLDETESITLRADQNTFSIQVSSINYDNPSNISYSWRLKGFYNEWNTPSDASLIHYTNLSPGTYELQVRAVMLSNNSILEERSLTIIIERPFWMTFWAFLIYGLVFIGLCYAGLRYQMLRRNRIASQEKIDFFIHTAHDIRTPLTLIKAPLGEILKNEHLSERGQFNINLAIQNTDSLSALANNLMNFQKEELYSSKVIVTQEELNHYLRQYLSAYEVYARQKGITLTYTSTVTRLEVWIDRNKMDSILRNLLTNALKYTPKGGTVSLHADHSRGYWSLVVSDTGIGIPRKDQKKLFRLLFRGSNATNQLITGTGIGMLLTYRLIRNHQGKITFHSTENVGSSFHLTFPIQSHRYAYKKDPHPSLSASVVLPGHLDTDIQRPSAPHHPAKDAPRLLIVEDNQSLRHFLCESLSDQYQVDEAGNGQEALERIAACPPDLIISDVMMPVMSGDQLCTHLKNHLETSHIAVILLTALGEREDILRGLKTKADQYIVKPFDLMVLQATITSLLENRRLLRDKIQQSVMTPEPPAEDIHLPSTLDQEFIDKVSLFVNSHIRNDISVESLCSHMGMSRTAFYNKIKVLTGLAPTDYIRHMRMQEAARLLRSHQYSVAEVAERMGFADPKYFTDTFKKFYGITPSAYMKGDTVPKKP